MSNYLHALAVKNSVPLSGHFELTQNCNFSCPMCYVHQSGRKKELDAKTWLSLAEQAKKAGTLFLLLTGGEPFLRDDFEEIYTGLSKMGFLISINTNGSLAEKYLLLLKKYPPFRVNVSLYAAEREEYKSFCGSDSFYSVKSSIEALQKSGISVRLNSVFTRENRDSAKEIISFSKEKKLHLKSTSYSYPKLRLGEPCGENRARLSPLEAAECEVSTDLEKFGLAAYAEKAKRLLSRENVADCGEEYRRVRCRAGRSSFWLTWDGKMRPCGMLPKPEADPLELGFEEAWRVLSDEVKKIRLPAECAVCERRRACPVCAAMCFCETGEFSKRPEYVCEFFENLCRLSEEALSKKKSAAFRNEKSEEKSAENQFDFEEDIYDC